MQLGSFLSPKLSGVGSPPPPSPGAGDDDRCAGKFLFNICYDNICKAQYIWGWWGMEQEKDGGKCKQIYISTKGLMSCSISLRLF